MEIDPDAALRVLLGRCSPDEFFSHWWESKYLWVGRASNPELQGFLPELLTLDGLDKILTTEYTSGRRPLDSVTMVQDGIAVPPESFLDKRVGELAHLDAGRVLELHRSGASIALNSIHKLSPPIAELCRNLSQRFSSTVHANAYITPPHSRGFSSHYDTHDVFIIQLAGGKTWQLRNSSDPLRTSLFVDDDTTKATGELCRLELTAGDVLYIPRGMFHEGLTSQMMSAHLTIGIQPYTCAEYLRDAATMLEGRSIEFRRSVASPRYMTVEEDPSFPEMLSVLMSQLNDPLLASAVLAGARKARSGPPRMEVFRGQLTEIFHGWNCGREEE